MPETNPKWWKFLVSKRFILALFMSVVTLFLEGIVGSLNTTFTNTIARRWINSDGEDGEQGPKSPWNSDTMMMAIRVISYGRLIAPLTSYITMKFGASTVIGIALAAVSVITFLTPLIIQLNLYLYVVIRIFQSLGEGIIYVSIPEFWAEWGPYQDRSRLMSIGLWGGYIAYFLFTYFCKYCIESKNYWTLPFYVLGGLTFIVSILWIWLVRNNPQEDERMNGTERAYIVQNIDRNLKPKDIFSTWWHILTSKPVWALAFCKFAYAFGPASILLFLPWNTKVETYSNIDDIADTAFHLNIIVIGWIPIWGYILDFRPPSDNRALTLTYSYFIFIGNIFSGTALILVTVFKIETNDASEAFLMANLVSICCIIIVQVHCINLAPQCACLVAAFTEFWYAVGHICGSIAVGLFVTKHTPEEWYSYISLVGITSFLCAATYLIFGSSTPQPWSYRTENEERFEGLNLQAIATLQRDAEE